MTDIRIDKLASMLVNYSVAVRPDDSVAIQAPVIARPLTLAIYRQVLEAGGHPIVIDIDSDTQELLYRYGSQKQLEYIHEGMRNITEKYDVRISILAPTNTKVFNAIDPAKMVIYSQARTELFKTMLRRSATNELRWTGAPFPTDAMAQDAEMSLADYEDFVYQACMPEQQDPIGYWKKITEKQQRIVEWLKGKDKVHVTGPETDLWLSVKDRTFINCSGNRNVPDGEIFTGPVENSTRGHVYFSYPAIVSGHEVTGVRLWFDQGKVVKATAEKNEEFLLKTIKTDVGASYIGEFAFGTNEGITRFTRQILFDEKIGGSFHMALGAGMPETGSQNESAIHWDMVCDLRQGGEVTVDGQLFSKNGKFTI